LARYNIDGSLDATFGNAGQLITQVASYDVPVAVAFQGDGKIVVAGYTTVTGSGDRIAVVRYLPDGSLDTTFGAGGKVLTYYNSGRAFDMVIQPDGKILVVGRAYVSTGEFALLRYLSDGSLDPSFGTGGTLYTNFSEAFDIAYAVALQPDGKIVAAGTTGQDFALARYDTNGDLDTSFGTVGKVITDLSGASEKVASVGIDTQGRIVAVGSAGVGPNLAFALARYMPNGDLDSSFDNDGKIVVSIGTGASEATSLVLSSDGKVTVAGYANSDCGGNYCDSDFGLARYLGDGTPDPDFGAGGQVITDFGPSIHASATSLVLQPDGKLVAAGFTGDLGLVNSNFTLVGYLPNGAIDTSFGTGGSVNTQFNGSNANGYGAALQPDGKIVVVGPGGRNCTSNCVPNLFAVARYLPDGSLDTSFGDGGRVTTFLGFFEAWAYDVAIQADNKIVVAGFSGGTQIYGMTAVVRYLPDGSLDSTFDGDGIVVTNISPSHFDTAQALIIQSDGKIVVGGYDLNLGEAILIRYSTVGELDLPFGQSGIARTQAYGPNGPMESFVTQLALQPDGKILAVGWAFDGYNNSACRDCGLVIRFNTNGRRDYTFGTNGIVTTSLGSGRSLRLYDVKVLEDGKIVVAGSAGTGCNYGCSSGDYGLIRYLPDGSPDSSFGVGGLVTTDFNGDYDIAYGVVAGSGGRLVVAGSVGTLSNAGKIIGLARYLPDGNLDESFGAGGKVTTQITYDGGTAVAGASTILVDQGNKVLVVGDAISASGNDAFVLARYENDVTCQAGVFIDVPSGSTFYTQITCLASRGIIGGYDDCTFRPGNNITRGQIAKVVSNAAGFDEDPGPQIYEDVPSDSPFYEWINRLSGRGHMSGYVCGLVPEEPCVEPNNLPYFRPNANATRGQLAKIVSNAAGITTTPTGIFFTDVPPDHPFYLWIMRLAEQGVMGGYECGGEGEPCDDQNRPYFRPQNNVTRGQASKIVANTFFPECHVMTR
jgi:uncharacterized delta-60 repeat protein